MPVTHATALDVPLSQLHQHPDYFNSPGDAEENRCLLESVQKFGILVPLLVCQQKDGACVIVDGYRRYRCASSLGLDAVPCLVHPSLKRGDFAHLRFELHDTHKPWTQAETRAWQQRMKRVAEEGALA